MMKRFFFFLFTLTCAAAFPAPGRAGAPPSAWIRINQLGYTPGGVKIAVLAAKTEMEITGFALHDAGNGSVVFKHDVGKDFGSYGPFTHTWRLDFSAVHTPGSYYLQAGDAKSPVFRISPGVYDGTADFCLQYMRQQRSGFNPFLKDSCHTHDGYTIYGPMPDGTHINVWGGWHDASDYLQYVTTSANATYHLLAAYRDFKEAFADTHQANGLEGKNGMADVLDEAKWGLDWLLKMHPRADWMFNQIADDRDHRGFRLPTEDTVSYGTDRERPVYFCTGEPQGLGKYRNQTTGTASTAGKFASAFALGYTLLKKTEPAYAALLLKRAYSAYAFGRAKPGVCQTAPNLAPYYYAEDDWTDDMELGAVQLYEDNRRDPYLRQAVSYGRQMPLKPWMGADTARHYQWYPFHNFGHNEIAKISAGRLRREFITYYREGIDKVWQKARHNAFYRGIPFIWCSNNLTVSFAIQCYLYRQLSGDRTYEPLEQACVDWLLGCNPWGTSMIIGLPNNGDYPNDPHSAFSHLFHYPVSGGLVDGPVYTSIYSRLIGVHLSKPDPYAGFQSGLAVYHDDWADYSTNEPTMDGTASLIYLLAAQQHQARPSGIKDQRVKKSPDDQPRRHYPGR